MKNSKELYKKISSLKDLRTAIKEVKKTLNEKSPVEIEKNDKEIPEQEDKPQHNLKYLARQKVVNGVLSHIIGTGEDNDPYYKMDVSLDKYQQKLPCVLVSLVSPKGDIKDQSSEQYKDMKTAIKALVNHHIKKSWK